MRSKLLVVCVCVMLVVVGVVLLSLGLVVVQVMNRLRLLVRVSKGVNMRAAKLARFLRGGVRRDGWMGGGQE